MTHDSLAKRASRRRLWLYLGLPLLAFVVGYIYWGANPDPRFNIAKLYGLTTNQVIAQLGPPDIDPRLPKFGSWTPNNRFGERLVFSYEDHWRWRGFTYGILFDNNRVVEARVGEK